MSETGGHPEAAASRAVPPRRADSGIASWIARAGLAVFGLALWIVQVSPPALPCPEAGDPVWQRILAHDLLRGVQAGTEVVFTYGPLSYFLLPHAPYVPEIFTFATAVRCLVIAAAVAIQLLVVFRLEGRVRKAGWLLGLTVTAPWSQDLVFPVTLVAAAVLALSSARFRRGPRAAVLVFAAGLALGKFTWFVIAGWCVLGIAVDAGIRFGWKRGAETGFVFLAGILGWWVAAGQDPSHLGAWLRSSIEVGRAYVDAMSVVHPEFPAGNAGLLAELFLLLLIEALLPPATKRRAVRTCLIGGVALLAWKSGAGRQGPAHALILFGLLSLSAPLVPAPAPAPAHRIRAATASVTCAATVVAGIFGFIGEASKLQGLETSALPAVVLKWAQANALTLADLEAARDLRDGRAAEIAAQHPLPAVRSVVGGQPIDVFGQNQGILFLNGLNLRHRPICQSYVATTAPLQALDAAFYEGPSAPPFVLAHLDPIDGRFAPVEDAAALLTLLRRYRPVLAERFYLLLAEVPEAPPPIPMFESGRRRAALGERVDLGAWPADARALACDIRLTPLGRLRQAFWQGPSLKLVLWTSAGRELSFTFSPRVAESPFLVDPLLDSTSALARYWIGGNVERVTAFAVEPGPGQEAFVAPAYDARIYDLGALAAVARKNGAAVAASLRHRAPMFPTEPAALEPPWAFRPYLAEGRAALIAQAPCRLEFALETGRHRLAGRYGVVPEAAAPGKSDGIEFIVTFLGEGAAPVEIGRRLMRPAGVPADRGFQLLSGEFDAPGAGRLRIDVGPGPAGDARWDSAWLSDIEIAAVPPPR